MAVELPLLFEVFQELQRSTILVSLLLLSLGFAFFLISKSATKHKLPPSPPKLPVIGNLHQLGRLPHRSLQSLSRKYGPLMLLHLGHAPTLIVSSADMVEEITKNHDIIFCNRPKPTAAQVLFYGCKDIGFSPYNEYWRQGRKVCILELLSLKRVLSFGFVREDETAGLVGKLRDASARENTVNLSEMLIATSNNTISRCILGRKFQEDDSKSKFGEVAKRVMIQFATFSFGDFFPRLSWLDNLTGLISSLRATFQELDTFLEEVIEDHKAGDQNVHSDKKDFVDILFQLQKDGMLEMELTLDNLKAILMVCISLLSLTIYTYIYSFSKQGKIIEHRVGA